MSMKLYYYFDNKVFICYTECDGGFDIFGLVKKVLNLKGIDYNFYEILQTVLNILNLNLDTFQKSEKEYEPIRNKYRKRKREVQLETFDKKVLTSFSKIYPIEWLQEGISREVMDNFNIRYSISGNKIIIPHYDIDNSLIGIRRRTFNPYEIELGNKYMPIEVENIWYSHPLSWNLYGLNINKQSITQSKQAILFEGEKSVLKLNSYGQNNSVATCGSSLNKIQIELLLKTCSPKEIIIAYDKEYKKNFTETSTKYLEKLIKLGERYKPYCDISILFDMEGLLKEKDSPVDKGYEVFQDLISKRIKI